MYILILTVFKLYSIGVFYEELNEMDSLCTFSF